MHKVRVQLAMVGVALLLFAVVAPAQTIYGSLTGTVFDASGAVVPNATVVVRSIDQGITRETKTEGNGFWQVPSLTAGRYQIEVTAAGFEKVIRGPIEVESSVERAVDVSLNPGSTSEVITITEETPLIEATRAQISKGVDAQRILELPGLNTLNGLALLMPGTAPNAQGRPGSGFVVNGGRTRSNNFMIDGANNNDQSLSIPRLNLAPEYMGEFRIITNNFSAEYGRNAGSVVMQTTRGGSNDFHGILRWTWLGNGLNSLTTNQQRTFNARKAAGLSDYAATRASRGVIVRNQWVVSGGGPVIKNRTFFYGGYDLDRRRSTAVPITTTISQQGFDILTQNQSFFAPGVVDFLKRTYPVANDPTPQGNLSVTLPDGRTIAVPLQQFNRGAGGALSYARDINRGFFRIDHKLSEKDQLQLRYILSDDTDPGTPAALEVNQVGSVGVNHNATINHVRVWDPSLIMETRLVYGRRDFKIIENMPAQFSITGSGLPTIGNQNYPQYRIDNLYELTNNWSKIGSNHTFRYGFNYLQYRLGSFFAPASRGVITYTSFANLLFDRQAQFSQYAGTGFVPAKTHELQTFFGDDWRVSSTLTLNLGIRYEYTSAPFGFFSNAKADVNNWAPRFGFAWAPKSSSGLMGWLSGNGKLAIRGGYAISYDQVFQNVLLNNARNFPRGVQVALANLDGQRLWDPASRPPAPTPNDYRGNPDLLPVRLFSPNKRISQPYGQQFSFGFERQLANNYAFKVFYVGSRGIKLVREVEQNLGLFQAAVTANPTLLQPVVQAYGMVPTTVSGAAAFKVNPARGSMLVGDGYAMSTYHSLQLTFEKRLSRNIGFESNYTWSSFINDSDDILGGQANRTLPSVPFNLRLDRARSGYDQPHRWVTNYYFQVPDMFGRKGLLGRMVDGWRVTGITTLASGTPFSVLNGNNPLGITPGQISTVNFSQRAGFNPGGTPGTGTSATVTNPMWVAYPNNSGIIGSSANILRTGGTINFDGALVKDVKTFGESQLLQFRWELMNIFNHRNFVLVPPNSASNNTNNTQFLNLGFTNVAGREMMFTLRYIF